MLAARTVFRTYSYSKSIKFMKSLQSFRNFQSTANVCIKMFMEYENQYAYSIMENKGYAITFNNIDKKVNSVSKEQFNDLLIGVSQKKPNEVFEAFSVMGSYCSEHKLCISDKKFDNFIDSLTDNIKFASDDELEKLFYSLVKFPETESVRTRNYIEVWAALDDECLKRLKLWDITKMLKFVALFYMLNVTRVSDFSGKALQKLASKSKQLSPNQLVQTLFFIGVNRRQPFDMHSLELHLDRCFQVFKIDDLAIMSMGFFKSKTPIRSMQLMSKIIKEVIESSKTVHEVPLAALVKIIRYSVKICTDDSIYQLLECLQHEVPRLSIMCNVHIALLGTATLTLHKACLTKIAERVISNLSECRLKDLERLVLTYGTFCFVPPTEENFFHKVMDELRNPEREPEIGKFGRCFSCCIAYLGLLSIYPEDLIKRVLSKEFLTKTYGRTCHTYGREILTLHNTSQIFCSDTPMNRLNENEAAVIAKKYTGYVPNENFVKQYNVTERMFLDVLKILKNARGGSKYVAGDHILTHHQRGDIIICNNADSSPAVVTEIFDGKTIGSLKRPPDDNKWIVLVIVGRNALVHKTDTATGHFMAKIRELRALGYYSALVPWSIYSKLETNEDKLNYLNSLINDAVNNNK